MTVLETERLLLNTWDEEDWVAFKPIAIDPQVMRFITGGRPWSDDEVRSFVNRNRAMFQERGFCRWKLVEKTSGNLVGFCGAGRLEGIPDPEIGWWLAPTHWGRGLAIEAARAAFRHVTEGLGVVRIVSVARPDNTASIRIMQKLGLQFEKRFEFRDNPVVMYVFERDSTAGFLGGDEPQATAT